MNKIAIKISNQTVTCLGDDALLFRLGKISRRRVSHILPFRIAHPVKLRWFKLLRKVFGDRGRVAQWTRGWNCTWAVHWIKPDGTMMRSPVFVHRMRVICVDWERRMLENRNKQ